MDTRVCRLHAKGDIRIEADTVAAPVGTEVLVAIGVGGICGSDLHYFHNGGFGPIQLREPMILGHEIAGTVIQTGPDVVTSHVGDRVALNPSHPCFNCKYCDAGQHQHCLNMRFFGSAMRFPHVQGAFRDRIVVDQAQCVKVNPSVTLAEAACCEPLAVCIHANNQVSSGLTGMKILVTGAGPIGVLCAALAARAGAAEVVVTDMEITPLSIASKMGATRTLNVSTEGEEIAKYSNDKGYFDVVFECSAAESAIRTAIDCVRPRGTIVQVGIAGDTPVPINALVGKEIRFIGTHRFHQEFNQAVALISEGEINVAPMVTSTYPLEDAATAFSVAGNRRENVKVQLSFDGNR